MSEQDAPTGPSISAQPDGPLIVQGGVPLYRRRAVHSEHGEPLAWDTARPVPTSGARYALCRCGRSAGKPFCDGTHRQAGFEAVETATGTYAERANRLGGNGISVRDDRSICVHAGFCGTRLTNIWNQVGETAESTVRLQVINMVTACPSGALTFRFDDADGSAADGSAAGGDVAGGDLEGGDVEPLLAAAVSVVDDGPLWVTGGIPVHRADGTPLEVRNRVTLCRCGASANKPLCDGSHKEAGFTDR